MASVQCQLNRLDHDGEIKKVVQPSPYPVYDNPLEMEGDALVLPDMEMPFHDADFLNKCLALAAKWNIKQAILAGDVLHFDSLSGWEAPWVNPNTGGITQDAESELMAEIDKLPAKYRAAMVDKIATIGQRTEQDGVSTELNISSRELKRLEIQFDRIDFVIGNHEGRLLRALQTALDPKILLKNLELNNSPKWRIAPFYFSYLFSAGEKYCIEHPKSAAASTAAVLAAKYGCHVLMGHSHHISMTTDVSGRYFAAEIGCVVDEARLPYAAQRHTRAPAHSLGAAIIRNGYPTILTKFTDWERLLNV